MRRDRKLTHDDVLAKMKPGAGASEGRLAQVLNVPLTALLSVIDDMVRQRVLVRQSTYRSGKRGVHLFIAGTEPGGSSAAARRASPLDNPRDISESSYCIDFRNHRALAELMRSR